MHRRLVAADQDAPAPQIAQILHRLFRFFRQAQQPVGIVAEQPACFGQRGVFGSPVNRRSPTLSSSRRTAWLMAGWVRWSFMAALEKLRSEATVRKTVIRLIPCCRPAFRPAFR
jgi:hypothetical protein